VAVTRVLLADDHRIVRDGLSALLRAEKEVDVVGEAEDGRTAVHLARELKPDVVIMDIGMPDLNGMDATRQIIEAVPKTRVIALSMHSDRRFVEGMLRVGASGYLLKDTAFELLIRAVQTVISGRTYLCPGITGVVVDDYVSRSADSNRPHDLLAPREREVLQLLAEGKTTKQIAMLLSVSAKTIETHRSRVMRKLGLHSVAELTKYAVREGLTFLDG
jgi:DNA-binding NarL/FixJ family response regulator